MPHGVVITLEAHRVAGPDPAWCDHCALMSAVSASFVVVDAATLRILHRFTVTGCEDCGRYWDDG